MFDPGWAALLGAIVGGAASLGGTAYTSWRTTATARTENDKLVAATAMLMQDDFYHFQVTLARALDRCEWWTQAELLPQQATVADRKIVWAALSYDQLPAAWLDDLKQLSNGDPGMPQTITTAVADAQGWMDYITQRRKVMNTQPPSPTDFGTMKWTFVLLDIGRRSLQVLAKRQATDFAESHVFGSLDHCRSVADLLGTTCP
jgi:hypothetical protein